MIIIAAVESEKDVRPPPAAKRRAQSLYSRLFLSSAHACDATSLALAADFAVSCCSRSYSRALSAAVTAVLPTSLRAPSPTSSLRSATYEAAPPPSSTYAAGGVDASWTRPNAQQGGAAHRQRDIAEEANLAETSPRLLRHPAETPNGGDRG